MGKAADRLALTEHMYESAPEQATDDVRGIAATASTLDGTARNLRDMAADLGITGSTGDAAWDAFAAMAKQLNATADEFSSASKVADTAHAAVVKAREAFRALPEGDIDGWQKAAVIGMVIIVNSPSAWASGKFLINAS